MSEKPEKVPASPLPPLAAIGALLIAFGIGWIYPPAGVIALGIELLFTVYVITYIKVRGGRT